nr:transposase [Nonomuraea rhizosphaerae]
MLTTTAGDLELQVPKLRTGLFFPSLLERRRRVDQALFAVVMEAYLHDVSTRKVDDLVKALGADSGISKSEVSQAVTVATGVTGDGRREVIGFSVGDSEDGAFWTVFLRSLKGRGLVGVQLVISDAHAGLLISIGAVLLGAAWQRCRCTSCATCSSPSPRARPGWSPQPSAPSSPSPPHRRYATSSA